MEVIRDIAKFVVQQVTIRGKQYPVCRIGEGLAPIFFTGIGSNMLKTLPEGFRKKFTIYSCDFFWTQEHKLDEQNIETITMKNLAQDTLNAIQQLRLDQHGEGFFIGGNSIWGTVAIETAKLNPSGLKGVLAIASPTYWTKAGSHEGNKHYVEAASEARKAEYARRMAAYEEASHQQDQSEADPAYYYTCLPKYLADYEQLSIKTNENLWHGAMPDPVAINRLFCEHLAQEYGHDGLSKDITKIKAPVVVFTGEHDYDCYPKAMWESYDKPPIFDLYHNQAVGHWPHWEDGDRFLLDVQAWTEKHRLLLGDLAF